MLCAMMYVYYVSNFSQGSHLWDAKSTTTGVNKQFFNKDGGIDLLKSIALEQPSITNLDDVQIIPMDTLKAGCFTLHDGLTYHGSSANKSKNTRIGIGLHFIPKSARFRNDAVKSKLWNGMYRTLQEEEEKEVLFDEYFPTVYQTLD